MNVGAYHIGELIGSAIGMVLIGSGAAWAIRRLISTVDFRISVGAAMAILAILAGFTNSQGGRSYLETVAMYGAAGIVAYFAVVMAWRRQQPRPMLSANMDGWFGPVEVVQPAPAPAAPKSATTAPGIAWARGFFRIWLLLAVLWVIAGVGISFAALATPYVPSKYVGINLENEAISLHDNYGDIARAMDAAVSNGTATKTAVRPGYALFTPVNIEPWRYYEFVEKATSQVDAYIQRETIARRSQAIQGAAAGTFLPPLIVLILGWAVGWAISGFRKPA